MNNFNRTNYTVAVFTNNIRSFIYDESPYIYIYESNTNLVINRSWTSDHNFQITLEKSGSYDLEISNIALNLNGVNQLLADPFTNNDLIGKWSYSSFINFQTQLAKGYRFSKDSNGNSVRTEKSRFFSPATTQLGIGLYWKKDENLWANVAPMTGKLILVNRFFTENLNENQSYFGVKKNGNSRFELGASVRSFYKTEIYENVTLENRLSLYSDYLDKPKNIDFDYTLNISMQVNKFISTNLIFQFVYDDNEIKRVQVREVLGLGLNIDLSNIDLSNIRI